MLQLKTHPSSGQYLSCRCGLVQPVCAAATASRRYRPPPVSLLCSNLQAQDSGCHAPVFAGGLLREHVTILRSSRPCLNWPQTAQRRLSARTARYCRQNLCRERLA